MRFKRGVHIEADVLQGMIVRGGQLPSEPGTLSDDVAAQLRLRLHNACLLARSFFHAGFTVVVDDIIMGERWEQTAAELAGLPVELMFLVPEVNTVIAERDPNRAKRPLGEQWARYLDAELRRTMEGIGRWIDSSQLSVDATVDAILAASPAYRNPARPARIVAC